MTAPSRQFSATSPPIANPTASEPASLPSVVISSAWFSPDNQATPVGDPALFSDLNAQFPAEPAIPLPPVPALAPFASSPACTAPAAPAPASEDTVRAPLSTSIRISSDTLQKLALLKSLWHERSYDATLRRCLQPLCERELNQLHGAQPPASATDA